MSKEIKVVTDLEQSTSSTRVKMEPMCESIRKRKSKEEVEVAPKYIKQENSENGSPFINAEVHESSVVVKNNIEDCLESVQLVTIEGMQNNPYVLLSLEEYKKLVLESGYSERHSVPSTVAVNSQSASKETSSLTTPFISSIPNNQPMSCNTSAHHTERSNLPAKPNLIVNWTVNKTAVLTWDIHLTKYNENICSYDIYTYEENNVPNNASLWKKMATVKALPLPMKFELAGFEDKKSYYFTVQGIDALNRSGPFSDPVCIYFEEK